MGRQFALIVISKADGHALWSLPAACVLAFGMAALVSPHQPALRGRLSEGATRKAADLDAWLETLRHLYGERIFAFDSATARHAGALSDRARGQGQAPGFADIIIAATALQHGLTILSQNLKHFAPLGVRVLDPFAALPPASP